MSLSLNDLRRIFYGAGNAESVSDAEYEFLLQAQADGISAQDLLQLIQDGPISEATELGGVLSGTLPDPGLALIAERTRWHVPYRYGPQGTRATGVPTHNREYAMRINVPVGGHRVDEIGVFTTIAGSATSVVILGIRDDTGDGLPGDLLHQTSAIDTVSATGTLKESCDVLIPGPIAWLVVSPQVATAATYRTVVASPETIGDPSDAAAGAAAFTVGYQKTAGLPGALTDPFTIASEASGFPRVWVRAASA